MIAILFAALILGQSTIEQEWPVILPSVHKEVDADPLAARRQADEREWPVTLPAVADADEWPVIDLVAWKPKVAACGCPKGCNCQLGGCGAENCPSRPDPAQGAKAPAKAPKAEPAPKWCEVLETSWGPVERVWLFPDGTYAAPNEAARHPVRATVRVIKAGPMFQACPNCSRW